MTTNTVVMRIMVVLNILGLTDTTILSVTLLKIVYRVAKYVIE